MKRKIQIAAPDDARIAAKMCIRDSTELAGQIESRPETEEHRRELLRYLEAVSYTHLDVYKRQLYAFIHAHTDDRILTQCA